MHRVLDRPHESQVDQMDDYQEWDHLSQLKDVYADYIRSEKELEAVLGQAIPPNGGPASSAKLPGMGVKTVSIGHDLQKIVADGTQSAMQPAHARGPSSHVSHDQRSDFLSGEARFGGEVFYMLLLLIPYPNATISIHEHGSRYNAWEHG